MNEFNDQYWMKQALNCAANAGDINEVPVGAVVVLDNKIIGRGWNKPISAHDPCAHAEIIALRDAAKNIENYRLMNATLYVTIEPCTMCAGAIIHSRIKHLVFGAVEPKSGAVGSAINILKQPYVNYDVSYEGGILADECSSIISAFFKRRRADIKAIKNANKQSEQIHQSLKINDEPNSPKN
jgi:tRNA(adenine34) deaminase